MRDTTIEEDVKKGILFDEAIEAQAKAKKRAEWHADSIDRGEPLSLSAIAEDMKGLRDAFKHRVDRSIDWCKIPKKRRDQAEKIQKLADSQLLEAACVGGDYSGDTSTNCMVRVPAAEIQADTLTSCGERYSRRSTHFKTDAIHRVVIDVRHAVSLWLAPEGLLDASRRDGLPLLDVSRKAVESSPVGAAYKATWVVSSGRKRIKAVDGWVAWAPDTKTTYHSTKSGASALRGLKRKVKLEKEQSSLGEGLNGTLHLAAIRRRTGWCREGCMEFIRRYLPSYEKAKAAPVEEVRRVAREIVGNSSPSRADQSSGHYAAQLLEMLPTEREAA